MHRRLVEKVVPLLVISSILVLTHINKRVVSLVILPVVHGEQVEGYFGLGVEGHVGDHGLIHLPITTVVRTQQQVSASVRLVLGVHKERVLRKSGVGPLILKTFWIRVIIDALFQVFVLSLFRMITHFTEHSRFTFLLLSLFHCD